MPGLKLVAELGGDGSGFDAMMRRANTTKDRFSSAFGGLKNVIAGAFTIGAVSNFSAKTIALAGHLRDVSDALRVNVEWFQKRANAAKLSGGSEDDLFKFIDTMRKQRSAAVQKPGGVESQTFSRLGFTGAEVSGLNTMEFFDRIVKAFGEGATAQTAVDVELVGGRSARNLLAAFGNRFASDAAVMSEQMVDDLDDIGDEFTILGNQLMVDLAPAILFVAKAIREAVNQIKQSGSFLGGASSGVTKFDLAQAAINPVSALLNGGRAAFSAGQSAAVSEARDQEAAAEQLEISKRKARELRKRREQSGPGFEPLDTNLPPIATRAGPEGPRRTITTDSLVGVGNFLGRNPSLVNNISNQQLAVARSQLSISQQTLNAIQEMKNRMAAAGANGTIQVTTT